MVIGSNAKLKKLAIKPRFCLDFEGNVFTFGDIDLEVELTLKNIHLVHILTYNK